MARRGSERNKSRCFLRRLARDVRGNTLAIMAIALIPMSAIVGSGVDMSRAYMAKVRLQQACDAGVLAGRRNMEGNVLDAASEQQARNFFNFNFPTGTFGATNVVFNPTHTVDADGAPNGQVTATASMNLPTTIMKMFGKPDFEIEVDCEAELNVTNTDVMFVLDVTGSMNCAAADTPSTCSNNGHVEKNNARIRAIRTAVVSFFDTLDSAIGDDARLRVGFVPYSTTVNVGYLLPAEYLVGSWQYQSRERVLVSTTPGGSTGNWSNPGWSGYSGYTVQSSVANVTSSYCSSNYPLPNPNPQTSYGTTTSTDTTTTNTSTGVVTTTTSMSRPATQTEYRRRWGVTDTQGTDRDCVVDYRTRTRTETRTDVATLTPNYDWQYKQRTFPEVATYKTGAAVTTLTGNTTATNGPATAQTSIWAGCIEERNTVAQANFSPIPDAAEDLDIDGIPDSDATRWRPAWPEIIWGRPTSPAVTTTDSNGSSSLFHPSGDALACPRTASKLEEMTHDQVFNYVNDPSFRAIGYTYHDTGMIWGARLISPDGIFGAENSSAPNGKPINRHIIFMTDGAMNAISQNYGLYGLEQNDQRIGGTNLTARHNARFSAICTAAKNKNITIWVVAYAQTMTTELENCASSGKDFYAADDAQLIAQFSSIADQIAELRLSK